jgi:hypothetical protein
VHVTLSWRVQCLFLTYLMAELELCCFFEGEDRYGMAKFSRDKLVVDLQEEIHKDWNKSYCKDVAVGDLALLKACQEFVPVSANTDFCV